MTLGQKIQELRQKHNYTLRQLSKKSGCSLGFLSQVERDMVSPTIASLKKIADALDVNLIHFFDEPVNSQKIIVRKNERNKLVNPKSKVTYELLRPQFSETSIQALIMKLEPGAFSGNDYHTHEGDEFALVISGQLEIHVGDDIYVLEPGDSALYKSTIPHKWKNPLDEPAEVIWVNTPPSF